MSNADEIRWQQRFVNFSKALFQLQEACEKDEFSNLERAGLVQVFAFTFELSWKTLKDLLFYEGHEAKSPREVIRKAFEMEYIDENDTETYLDALDKRNLLSHIYEEAATLEAERLITQRYYPLMNRIHKVLENKRTS